MADRGAKAESSGGQKRTAPPRRPGGAAPELTQTLSRLELRRNEGPFGMAYDFDEAETRQSQIKRALHQGGKRFASSMADALHETRCSKDWLYSLIYEYDGTGMGEDLDAAMSFVLRKYAIGCCYGDGAALSTLPPMALHPTLGVRSAEGQGQNEIPVHIVADCELRPNPDAQVPATDCPVLAPLPDCLREGGSAEEIRLFSDSMDRWFVRDTFLKVRNLPPHCNLYKRFLLLVIIGMEPEIYEQVVGGCPSEFLFGKEAEQEAHSADNGNVAGHADHAQLYVSKGAGYRYQDVLKKLIEPLLYNFNRFNAPNIVRGFMLRAALAYESNGAIAD